MSFQITEEQQAAIDAAREDPRQQLDGMARWEIMFTGGKHATMLTNDCRDRASAILGAIERFGAKVMDVK